MKCDFCGRNRTDPCRNTRDMKEIGDKTCDRQLMNLGGGEYTVDRLRAEDRARAFKENGCAFWHSPVNKRCCSFPRCFCYPFWQEKYQDKPNADLTK